MKTIILTGASGGIGCEIAKTLANENTNLILVYNSNETAVAKLFNEIKKIGTCETYKCNLTNVNEIDNLVNYVIKKYKKIDCLVNCAGVSLFKQIQDHTEDDYNFVMDANFKSIFFLTSKVTKFMISEKCGKIVNISSMWGNVGSSLESLYSASKSAINNLTLSLAKELGPSNVQVNTVCPGLINTKMNNNLTKETIQDIVNSTPLNRIGTPKDVANLVEFLLSEKADFITGQIITIDGGFSL